MRNVYDPSNVQLSEIGSVEVFTGPTEWQDGEEWVMILTDQGFVIAMVTGDGYEWHYVLGTTDERVAEAMWLEFLNSSYGDVEANLQAVKDEQESEDAMDAPSTPEDRPLDPQLEREAELEAVFDQAREWSRPSFTGGRNAGKTAEAAQSNAEEILAEYNPDPFISFDFGYDPSTGEPDDTRTRYTITFFDVTSDGETYRAVWEGNAGSPFNINLTIYRGATAIARLGEVSTTLDQAALQTYLNGVLDSLWPYTFNPPSPQPIQVLNAGGSIWKRTTAPSLDLETGELIIRVGDEIQVNNLDAMSGIVTIEDEYGAVEVDAASITKGQSIAYTVSRTRATENFDGFVAGLTLDREEGESTTDFKLRVQNAINESVLIARAANEIDSDPEFSVDITPDLAEPSDQLTQEDIDAAVETEAALDEPARLQSMTISEVSVGMGGDAAISNLDELWTAYYAPFGRGSSIPTTTENGIDYSPNANPFSILYQSEADEDEGNQIHTGSRGWVNIKVNDGWFVKWAVRVEDVDYLPQLTWSVREDFDLLMGPQDSIQFDDTDKSEGTARASIRLNGVEYIDADEWKRLDSPKVILTLLDIQKVEGGRLKEAKTLSTMANEVGVIEDRPTDDSSSLVPTSDDDENGSSEDDSQDENGGGGGQDQDDDEGPSEASETAIFTIVAVGFMALLLGAVLIAILRKGGGSDGN